jgi:hypothetical protein
LPPKRDGDHTIPLMPGSTPFRLRPYRYNPYQKNEIEKQIKEMLEKGLIKHSASPFSSLALLVKKTGVLQEVECTYCEKQVPFASY